VVANLDARHDFEGHDPQLKSISLHVVLRLLPEQSTAAFREHCFAFRISLEAFKCTGTYLLTLSGIINKYTSLHLKHCTQNYSTVSPLIAPVKLKSIDALAKLLSCAGPPCNSQHGVHVSDTAVVCDKALSRTQCQLDDATRSRTTARQTGCKLCPHSSERRLIPARHQHTGIISSQGTCPQALRSANAASPSSPRDFP
jgi:hypothetical protein